MLVVFLQPTLVGQMALNALKSQSPGNLHYRVIIQMEREHSERLPFVAGKSLHHQRRLVLTYTNHWGVFLFVFYFFFIEA